MACDIFIRSYWKDLDWLDLCLASIAQFCRGFQAVIVVLPRSTAQWLRQRPVRLEGVRLELCPDYPDDYLGQQVTKLSADRWSDAELICHVDADCNFSRPPTPADLLDQGRPRIVARPYALLGRYWPWQRPTEEFLGWQVSHDYMQQPPFVFPRWLYGELRDHAVARHGMELDRYILSRSPRGFSEFNALSAYARARHADRFVWVDSSVSDPGAPPCRWYWSWGGIDEPTRSEVEQLLGPRGAASG